jgi:hypothetical protein
MAGVRPLEKERLTHGMFHPNLQEGKGRRKGESEQGVKHKWQECVY